VLILTSNTIGVTKLSEGLRIYPYETTYFILVDDWGSRVRFPAGAGNFSLHHRVQNSSGAQPASYPMDIRGSFPGRKAARA
jgi:hypothetical protein